MRPALQDTNDNARPAQAVHVQPVQTDPATPPHNAAPAPAPVPVRPTRPAPEYRLNERLGRLLRRRKGPDALMLGVLSVALFCGLVGFAVHFLWVVAILVMALGLGFTIADSRRNRIDLADQRSEKPDPDVP